MSFIVTVELLNELFVEYQRSAKYMPGKMPSFGDYVSNYTMAQNNNNLVAGAESRRFAENSAPVSSAVAQSDKLVKQESNHLDSKRKIVDISDEQTVEEQMAEEQKKKKIRGVDKTDEIGIHFASVTQTSKLAQIRNEIFQKFQTNADNSNFVKRVADFLNAGDVKEFSLATSPEETFVISRLVASSNYIFARLVTDVEKLIDKNSEGKPKVRRLNLQYLFNGLIFCRYQMFVTA